MRSIKKVITPWREVRNKPQIESLETDESQVLDKARKLAFGEAKTRSKMKGDSCLSEATSRNKPFKGEKEIERKPYSI